VTALPPWRLLLRGAREREGRSPNARWLQLASVAGDGSPRVRTLVFRGWADDTVLDLLTDGRSAKHAELQQQPAVELCWLLPKARCQFRLRGRLLTLPKDEEWGAGLNPEPHSMHQRPSQQRLRTTLRCPIISSCCALLWSRWSCWSYGIIRTSAAAGAAMVAGWRSD